ncbi:MAG TPA: 50S ribosomal protein L21 [Candidatus Pacearchaeota archaeon]|nr:50S ribosomal protein L21 [Candidatus Parcubacteria bacterium]HNZ84053.1 50S ribosomal protein L21 [Candidatus Pacearchaeota archaeon]HOU45918.1 50S ribosomal protein L21 [Candidatus Pacearchaeota archaeon]HPM08211.1 50S ribosomal protein L21 [Candidatus Pacearchaeota archaeon]HQI74469.1 50S ribosomal protein L21 [Candidatus Pacearchaeota archaeon]
MFAVIKTGGKQYIVAPNQKLRVEKLESKDENIEFLDVLLIEKDGKIEVGNPMISEAKVTAKITKQDRAKKVTVLKYKSKTRYQVKKGHRQPFTEVQIVDILSK